MGQRGLSGLSDQDLTDICAALREKATNDRKCAQLDLPPRVVEQFLAQAKRGSELADRLEE